MSFPRYERYRESGVAWLGEVPEHWTLVRLCNAARIENGFDYKQVEVEAGGFPVFGSGGSFARAERYLYTGPSVLLGRKGTIDKPLFVDTPFWTVDTCFYTVVRDSTSAKYLFYQCVGIPFDLYATGTALPSMTQSTLQNIPMVVPPLSEQHRIVAFLERETAKIDALIEEQRRLIALLKEKRQAVISHAVTKGLDPTAQLQSSSCDWLGDVPRSWVVCPLRYRYEVALGKMLDEKKDHGIDQFPYLRNVDVQWDRIDYGDLPTMPFDSGEIAKYSLRRGDLLVCEGGELGRAALVKEDVASVFYQKALHRLRPILPSRDIPRFMLYLLWDSAQRARFIAGQNKATIGHLPAETLRTYRFGFPPQDEQQRIVMFLDSFMKSSRALVGEASSAIDLLKERRSALISSAVTGKIDVRAHAAKPVASVRRYSTGLAQVVLGGEILSQCNDAHMGRTKLQKLIYLAEHHARLSEIQGEYTREIAGPLDRAMMRRLPRGLERRGWFREERQGSRFRYVPLEKKGEHTKYLTVWADRQARIDEVLGLLGSRTMRWCELVATLYAAWNDLLLNGEDATEEAILQQATTAEGWNASKERTPRAKWMAALGWMRQKGLVPTGWGTHTRKSSKEEAYEPA